jgi:hypothetical protein
MALMPVSQRVQRIAISIRLKNLGKPVSHGCVRISPENAATLYALVKENGLENTQVVLTGVTPGGEFKFARGQAGPGLGGSGRFRLGLGPIWRSLLQRTSRLQPMAVDLLTLVKVEP